MLTLRKVAITGGLSCGKSSVCQIFKELGAHVISADEIVHKLLVPTQPLGRQVIALFGKEIVVNGKIDRSIIAKKVFKDEALLRSLEELLHPAVLSEIEKQYQQTKNQGITPLFIAEIPLLFETGSEKRFDTVIAVWTEPKAAIQRVAAATGYDENEYLKRMANQMPADEKAKRADYVINNSGTMEELQKAVVNIFNKLTN
jgi:dephospho-CoA kinase